MALRHRRHEDDELPLLPPLDGQDDEPLPLDDLDGPNAPGEADGETPGGRALDDEPADDLALGDEIEAMIRDATDGLAGDDRDVDDTVDVGAADEIHEDDGGGWRDEGAAEGPPSAEELDLPPDEGGIAGDRGEEGPEHDPHDVLGDLPPLGDDDSAADEAVADLDGVDPLASPDVTAFELPLAATATVRRLPVAGLVTAVALGAGRLLVVGEGMAALALDALDDPDAVPELLDAPDDELLASVAEDAAGVLYVGTFLGNVFRAARGGLEWKLVATLTDGRATGPVEVATETRRVWARTHGGGLFRSEDGHWFEGPARPESVRGMAVEPDGGLVVATAAWGHAELHAAGDAVGDGTVAWNAVVLPAPYVPRLLARRGDTWAVARGAGTSPGYVSVDGGGTWAPWEVLAGATALVLCETDDGMVQVVFAVHREVDDRAVLVVAGIDGQGAPVAPRRIADLDPALRPTSDTPEDAECRVDVLLALDRAGRKIIAATPRGVALVERGS